MRGSRVLSCHPVSRLVRFGEWRAYNQPLAAIQAPKPLITMSCEARVNRRWNHGDSTVARRRTITPDRSEEHTSELQSLMRISYAVFCLKKKKQEQTNNNTRLEYVLLQYSS